MSVKRCLCFDTRILRVTSLTLLGVLIIYLMINIGLAWTTVFTLTHPPCERNPTPLDGFPTPQEVSLHTADGLSLRGWYYPSRNDVAILSLGGLGGSLGNNLPPVAFLVKEGYGVLQIDSRACAEPRASVTLGANEVLDAEAGLVFLKTQGEVKRIGAMGFSMGGATVIQAAARNPEILAVVAEGSYYNLGRDFIQQGMPKPFFEGMLIYSIAGMYWLQLGINPWEVSPIDELPRISPRPVLLIYGEKENTSGRADIQFAGAGDPKELWIVAGGSHGTNHQVASEEYKQKVLGFFNRVLLAP